MIEDNNEGNVELVLNTKHHLLSIYMWICAHVCSILQDQKRTSDPLMLFYRQIYKLPNGGTGSRTQIFRKSSKYS